MPAARPVESPKHLRRLNAFIAFLQRFYASTLRRFDQRLNASNAWAPGRITRTHRTLFVRTHRRTDSPPPAISLLGPLALGKSPPCDRVHSFLPRQSRASSSMESSRVRQRPVNGSFPQNSNPRLDTLSVLWTPMRPPVLDDASTPVSPERRVNQGEELILERAPIHSRPVAKSKGGR